MLKKSIEVPFFGIETTTIIAEVNIAKRIGYHLVGLSNNAIRERNYRIASALHNKSYKISEKKIRICMVPPNVCKEGNV
ncbi:magnesium chelatase domain-containing protein [Kordia sp.]|uniref:magnesium chelatase domain-containing protein n=1 Tax=Kordia sp. TaxID=1965332 RepID=UPI003D6AA7EA